MRNKLVIALLPLAVMMAVVFVLRGGRSHSMRSAPPALSSTPSAPPVFAAPRVPTASTQRLPRVSTAVGRRPVEVEDRPSLSVAVAGRLPLRLADVPRTPELE